MKKYISILLFLLTVNIVFGQTPVTPPMQPANGDRLNLVSSSSGRINSKTGHMTFYNPVYEHKGNTLSADSGYLYENAIKQQFFEAFGNVVITQPSGTVIYSDKLYYDATSQQARLNNNVKMVDKNSTLTTNFLTYNMRSKVGTYTGGGRIISNTDTITSQRAFYFENQGEAFFSKKVVVRNPSVKVYTDSMRYYSVSKDTHFYGPTNIKGNNKENLYTERGVYNTATGVADFNKNNLYTEGSRFLKGDSLHYERTTGIGEAFKNVVFVDTTDKFYAYGNKGLYRQSEESILMTDKPYIITVVKNDSDSSTTDSTVVEKPILAKKDTSKEKKKDNTVVKDSKKTEKEKPIKTDDKVLTLPEKEKKTVKMDSVYMTADTLFSRMILAKDYIPLQLNLNKDGGALEVDSEEDYGDDEDSTSVKSTEILPTPLAGKDSTENKVETQIQKKAETPLKETVKKTTPTKPKTTNKQLVGLHDDRKQIEKTIKSDSLVRQQAVIPKLNHAENTINDALKIAQSPDTVKALKDTSNTTVVSDTARTRIVKAFYNVRLFKSDLQAVADSVYYGMQDSMFRFMGNPMIWSQGTQISADTIFMQIINQQMDNALLKENAFMVNAVLDSLKFNQIKGRKITTFFANNNIDRLFVDGNAENLVFAVNDKTKLITEAFHDRGGRIKVKMKGKEVIDYVTIRKVDQKVYPFSLITQENEILPGFKWRPEDRPKSKDDLLNRKREIPKDDKESKDQKQGAPEVKEADKPSEKVEPQTKKMQPAPIPKGNLKRVAP